MGKAIHVLSSQAHALEEGNDPLGKLLARGFVPDSEGSPDDVLHQLSGIERTERVLEYDLAIATVGLPSLSFELIDAVIVFYPLELAYLLPCALGRGGRFDGVQAGCVFVREPEVDPAPGHLCETADTTAKRCLAASGLTYETDRLTGADVKGHAVDGPDVTHHPLQGALLNREVLLDSPE
jgi:hypothetical protein